MSFLENSEILCEFLTWLHGEVEDATVGALDRFFKNFPLLEGDSDSPEVNEKMDRLTEQAHNYATGYMETHVPQLKKIRDATASAKKPCELVYTWRALANLDEALDLLENDNNNNNFNAAHRTAALEAAGKAINEVGKLMAKTTVLKGYAEFLAEFVTKAWEPLTIALNIYFRRIAWIDNVDPVTNDPIGPQPN